MSYSKSLSSKNPGLFLFLIDQSTSMADMWGGDTNKSKADQVTDVLNRFLRDLTLRCAKSTEIRSRLSVSVIGYGSQVGSAFLGNLAGKSIIDIAEVAKNPARVEQRIKKDSDGAGGIIESTVKFPIWVDSIATGGTPMKEGFQKAIPIIKDWIQKYPDSYPPIVINVTDGEFTSGSPQQEVNEIKSLSTNDGNTLIFNIHISSSKTSAILFPSGEESISTDKYAKDLFAFSSVLPDSMFFRAAELYPNTSKNARGFAFNGDLATLVNFLDIGSTVDGAKTP